MDASTRILRGLVLAELAVALAGGAASLWLWDTLPPALRDYEPPGPELFGSMVPAMLAFALLPLGLAAWLGVWLLWRPARRLYTAAAAAGLAITPLFGPTVEPTWVGTLFDLGTMSSGAILALLYLSPAARHFGRAPTESAGSPAPRNRLSSGALVVGGAALGFLAALGAVGLAFLGFGVFVERASQSASDAGRTYGTSRQDTECVAGARGYEPDSAFASTSAFLSACLEAASPSEGFCNGVPAPDTKGSYAWQVARCEGDADPDGCAFLQETVQEHCHPNAESL